MIHISPYFAFIYLHLSFRSFRHAYDLSLSYHILLIMYFFKDNGAYYYYLTEPNATYAQTMVDVYRYIQV